MRTRAEQRTGPLRGLAAALAALTVALAAATLPLGRSADAAKSAAEPSTLPVSKAVSLVVDYGDGVEKHFTRLTHAEGMTVFAVLKAASGHPRGITLDATGSGETAFVRGIDGLANEGGGGSKHNWQFEVNGEFAKRGSGVYVLSPGDRVRWFFGPWKGGGGTTGDAGTRPTEKKDRDP